MKILALILLVICFVSCSDENESFYKSKPSNNDDVDLKTNNSDTIKYHWTCSDSPNKLNPNAIVLNENSIASISKTGDFLKVPQNILDENSISVDSVLVGGDSKSYLYHKVVSILPSREGDFAFVKTERPKLNEVFQDLCIQMSVEKGALTLDETFTFDHNVPLDVSIGERFSMDGDMRFTGGVRVGVQVLNFKLTNALVVFLLNSNLKVEPTFLIDGKTPSFEEDYEFKELELVKAVVPVGPVVIPIEIELELETNVSCEAKAGISVKTQIEANFAILSAIAYSYPSGWAAQTETDKKFEKGDPQLEIGGKGSCEITFGPDINVEAFEYVEVGLGVGLSAKVEAEFDAVSNLCTWNAKGGFTSWAVAEIEESILVPKSTAKLELYESNLIEFARGESMCVDKNIPEKSCEPNKCQTTQWCDVDTCVDKETSDHTYESPNGEVSSMGKFLTHPIKEKTWVRNGWEYHKGNGYRKPHYATDYALDGLENLPVGTAVYASCDGIAMQDSHYRNQSSFGKFVLVRCDQKSSNGQHYFTLYAHMSKIESSIPYESRHKLNYFNWVRVNKGDLIGLSGKDDTLWPHLHFEVFLGSYSESRVNKNLRVDPYDLYTKTDATQDSRDFYPPNGSKFTKCGSKSLWITCPPSFQEAPFTVVNDNGTYWVIEDGFRHRINTWEGYLALGKPNVVDIANVDLLKYEESSTIDSLKQGDKLPLLQLPNNSTIWSVQPNGTKRAYENISAYEECNKQTCCLHVFNHATVDLLNMFKSDSSNITEKECRPDPNCDDKCSLNDKICTNSTSFRQCERNSNNCLVWSRATACPTDTTCNNQTNQCESNQSSCTPECSINERTCTANNSYRVCERDANNCLVWSRSTACLNNTTCNTSTGQCQTNQTQCDSNDPCCDSNGNFRPSTFVCNSNYRTSYRCQTNNCGGDAQYRVEQQYCSGSSGSCNGQTDGSWVDISNCLPTQKCTSNATSASCYTANECSSCSASDYWSPTSIKSSDSSGHNLTAPTPAKLEIEFKDANSNGQIQFRICKFLNGQTNSFNGNPIHVHYTNQHSPHHDTTMFEGSVNTSSSSNCSSWANINRSFSAGQKFGGQVRIVSPASSANQWGNQCSSPASSSGYCWFIGGTGSMTRTCK